MTPIDALDRLEAFAERYGPDREDIREAIRVLDRLRQEKNSLGTMLSLGRYSRKEVQH